MTKLDADLAARTIRIVEERVPELAPSQMLVPLSWYRDPLIHEEERRLFLTLPRPLAGSTQLANPHDYLVRESMGLSVLLTRDGDGQVHAFLNYCRHRGAEPAKGCGNSRRFSCPYHGWTYDTRGQLVAMPLADRNETLDYGKLGLVELPCEERHGLVWVILTPGLPIDIAAHLGAVDGQLAQQGLDRMHYFPALQMAPVAANWKCIGEGIVEALHLPFVHAATFDSIPRTDGGQARNLAAGFTDTGIYDRVGNHVRWMIPKFDRTGIPAFEAALARDESFDWRAISNIWILAPGIIIANDQYGFDIGVIEPGQEIDRAFMHYGWMAPTEPPEGYPPPEAMAERAARAIIEDQVVWEGCGRGLAKGAHDYVVIGRNEKGVQLFHEILADLTGRQHPGYL